MQDLRRVVAAIHRRLRLFQFLDALLAGAIVGLTAVAVFLFVLKFFPYHTLPVYTLAGGILAAALLIAGSIPLFRRFTIFEAALVADTRLQLRERLSSAIALDQPQYADHAGIALVEEDARQFAMAIQPRRDFKYEAPRYARHGVWPALAIAALFFVPPIHLFDQKPPTPTTAPFATLTPEQRKAEAEELRKLAKQVRKQEENLKPVDDLELANRLERLAEDVALGKKDRKDMAAEMSRMQEEIKIQQRQNERATQPFRQMKGLQQAEQTQELQKDLKNQDFAQAAKKMEALAEKLKDPSKSSAEEKKQLAEELRQMAEQLKDQQQLSKALEEAAKAVEQAAKQQQESQQGEQQQQNQQAGEKNAGQQNQGEQSNAANQSSQQQQQQQQSQQEGQSASQNQSASQLSQQQQAGENAKAALQEAAKQISDMQDAMSQMQALSQLQSQMNQSMGQAMASSTSGGQKGEGQGTGEGTQPGGQGMGQPGAEGGQPGSGQSGMMGQGQFAEGEVLNQGMGSGGPGIGEGGKVPDSGANNVEFSDVFIPGEKGEGDIIAIFEVDAQVPVGESRIDYSRVPANVQQRGADSINNQEIPAGMRNNVRSYFEAINLGENKAP